jgi:hypothetical protein
VARREYSPEELKAFRTVGFREWKTTENPAERGPAQYAAGPYWPKELRRQAAKMQSMIPKYLLAADALEREIEKEDNDNA